MSDIRYRTIAQLENDIRYNRRMQNTHKMRADAAEQELVRRQVAEENQRAAEAEYEPQAVS